MALPIDTAHRARRGVFARFDALDGDGKVAVGRWDRFMTLGEKVKDGAPAPFTPDNLRAFVANWYARGGRLPMCLDHASALGGVVPAPAAAYYDALAVIVGGRVIECKALPGSTAQPPEVAQLGAQLQKFATDTAPDEVRTPDGLWGWRCAVTPLGAHPTEGLANYAGISPLFTMHGTDEQGNEIGPVLFDVAAVNVNFQAGCELAASRLGATSMAGTHYFNTPAGFEDLKRRMEALKERTRRATSWADVKSEADQLLNDARGASAESEVRQLVSSLEIKARRPLRPDGTRFDKGAQQMGIDPKTLRPGDKVRIAGTTMTYTGKTQSGLHRFVNKNAPDGEGIPIAWDDEYIRSSGDITKLSALGGAGATMNPEMLNKMGLAADCAPSDKMAKFAAYAMEASDDELKAMAADLDGMEGDEPKKMAARMRKMAGEMPPQVQMDVDPGNLPQNAAIHLKTGNVHDEGGRKAGALSAMGAPPFAGKETPEEEKAEAQAMAALAASVKAPAGASRAQVFAMAALASRSPDPAAVDALVEKKLQEREAKQAEAQRKSDMADLMKFARDGGAKDEDIKLLDIIAASDLASARAYLQRIVPGAATGAPPYLFGRMTAAGGPIGAAGAGSPRDIAAARRPKVRNAGAALVYVEDDEYGAEIERIAFSAVPADKAAVDAHIVGSDEQKADKVQRLLAARKVVDAQRPDLAEAITMARIGR